MSLSSRSKEIMVAALADRKAAKEVNDAIDAANAAVAAKDAAAEAIAALAAYSPVTGVDGTASNAASKVDVDARFTALYAKINAILAAAKV